ncbi:hypothetical protein HMPREF9225_1818 [Peptoniphilus duerdenii ATCC BAA-1640]|uniref:Uncharacterized protein n=1 Tax=Peptoniphilus duerdenii ATCC BAA-1640 TaxID=862517 RepID=E0NNS9_9FIRM|nr:hypothetical protein HMPREF9225_1818 [Peptoniphilus duerdenii ATCC BAA-1640]
MKSVEFLIKSYIISKKRIGEPILKNNFKILAYCTPEYSD